MLLTRFARCSELLRSKVKLDSTAERITPYKFNPCNTSVIRVQILRHFQQEVETKSNLFSQFKNGPVFVNGGCKVFNVPKHCGSLYRPFHSTSRRPIPPVVWVIMKPLMKIGVVFFGRRARGKIPVLYILFGVGVMLLMITSYYFYHFQHTPITGRMRFIIFTSSQLKKLCEDEAQMYIEKYRDKLLPANHPAAIRVQKIATKLLQGNKELQEMILNNDIKLWSICIIDDPKERNAFVLSSGHIFVFTGMLNFVDNDNQLAVVIGHEMSHAYLSHAAELLSNAQFLDWIIIALMAAIWPIIPFDGVALVTQWFKGKCIDLMCRLPYNRKLEAEADKVGLQFAAKACFDVREGAVFWSKMNQLERLESEVTKESNTVPEWLSTHPLSEKRCDYINKLIPKALVLQEECNCPRVPLADPRDRMKLLSNFVDNEVAIKKTGRNLSKFDQAFIPKPAPA